VVEEEREAEEDFVTKDGWIMIMTSLPTQEREGRLLR
jgi:hypothetical protein